MAIWRIMARVLRTVQWFYDGGYVMRILKYGVLCICHWKAKFVNDLRPRVVNVYE